MSQRALTLKYRPQVFSDLIGQDHVSLVLTRALESGRVAHAYLFTGARGVGKTTSARILAKALNCTARKSGKQAGADPCNECTSCTEITSGVSLDVAEIDGASNRGIADVQSLREKVRFAPTGGHNRIVIIDEVHQLSNDAFAALLKTLEEPPAHLVFIFATTDPQKLPDTIRSRTQRFDFARVPLRKVADRLLEIQKRESKDKDGVKFELTEGAALLIAHKGEGSMRDAVSALDQVVSAGESEVNEELVRRVLGIADREVFFTMAEAVVRRDPAAALHAVHAAFEKGLDPRDIVEGLAEHVRHLLILKVDPQGSDLVPLPHEDLARLREQGKEWSEGDLLRLLKIASEAGWPMRDSSQPLVHLEAAVLQMATLESGETLADVLAKLEALEGRIGGGAAPRAGGGSAPTRASSAGPAAPPRTTQTSPAVRTGTYSGERGGTGGAPTASAAGAPSYSRPAGPAATPAAAPAATPALRAAPTPAMSPTPAMTTAPAATSAASAPVALAEADPELDAASEACWRAAVAAVNARKRMLGAFLEESRFTGLAADALLLGMDDLHAAVVNEKDNRALLAEELQRAFGRVLQVRRVALTDAPEPPRPPANEDVGPLVDQAIAFFDGEVIEPRRSSERTNG
jgi:DNA polymerase-3 subunit gamma/tau